MLVKSKWVSHLGTCPPTKSYLVWQASDQVASLLLLHLSDELLTTLTCRPQQATIPLSEKATCYGSAGSATVMLPCY